MKSISTAMFALAALCAQPALAQTPAAIGAASAAALPMPAEKPELKYLAAADLLPQRLLPMPPVRGSEREALELQVLHKLIADATPDRLARAAVDGEREDPSIFNEALGRDLRRLPATWALLVAVQDEVEAAIGISKEAFGRIRPYGIDDTMPTCTKVDKAKAARSYPSGHAGLGWGVGWFLIRLVPTMAPAILDRADDYALSRELCGVHFASDTEASHVVGTVVAERLLNDPRLAGQIAAARAELASTQ